MKKTVAQTVKEQMAKYNDNEIKGKGVTGILAALLGNIPDKTLTVLLNEGIRGLVSINQTELERLPGIGRDKALRLLAAVELAKMLATTPPVERPAVKQPEDAARLVMEEMRYLDREQFRIIHLNTKNQVTGQEVVATGTLNSTSIHPREVFKNAVKASTAAIIAVHNHPSGDPTPSREDIQITKRLIEAGEIIGIQILDHLIIGDGRFVSFKAREAAKS